MNNQHCEDCRYFLRHYTFDSRKIFRVYCGHCSAKRVGCKQPDSKACELFAPGQDQEAAFASKEYLSKELLRYLLSLELLPKIENDH